MRSVPVLGTLQGSARCRLIPELGREGLDSNDCNYHQGHPKPEDLTWKHADRYNPCRPLYSGSDQYWLVD
jgi:hypothetical protein